MAKLEDLPWKSRLHDEILSTELSKPIRIPEEDVSEEGRTQHLYTQSQIERLIEIVTRNEEVLANHLVEGKDIAQSLSRMDKTLNILVDPELGYIPQLKRNFDQTSKELFEIKLKVSSIDHDIHNGLSSDIARTKELVEGLSNRLEGCEDDIIELQKGEAFEDGVDHGGKESLRVIGRRKEDRHKNITLLISIAMALIATISAAASILNG